MSRDRARRREERERVAAAARADRERRASKAARRRERAGAVRAVLPRRTRWRRQQGLLARRRRTENGVIAVLWLAAEGVVWLLTSDPWLRGAALLLGLLALPVLVTLTLDRRSRG
jgi:Flp pilus assembly protein TadB